MASGFVSGGTTELPTERDDEWLKAQQELEAERRRKASEGKQEGEKSLYEILQQNKGEPRPVSRRSFTRHNAARQTQYLKADISYNIFGHQRLSKRHSRSRYD